jgi:polar amino acid transport system substrate-binding protein
MKIYASLLMALAACSAVAVEQAREIVVQADRWCPFNCEPNSPRPGYVVEILQKTFEQKGTTFTYQIVPWDRATKNAEEGKIAGVIGASATDARERSLLIGREPVGIASDCLYVAASNPLEYRNALDLDTLRKVAVVSGYSYAEGLGQWVTNPKNASRIETGRGENPSEINLNNLVRGRIDGVIDDGSVLRMLSEKLNIADKVRLAGCTGKEPIFVAFSPKAPDAAAMVSRLDREMAAMRKNGSLRALLKAYGQKDWK